VIASLFFIGVSLACFLFLDPVEDHILESAIILTVYPVARLCVKPLVSKMDARRGEYRRLLS
jgi:hypothetical protein